MKPIDPSPGIRVRGQVDLPAYVWDGSSPWHAKTSLEALKTMSADKYTTKEFIWDTTGKSTTG